MLDRVFYAYVDMACMELWCDARVVYQLHGETVIVDEYGFEDGQYTMRYVVHCGVADPEALVAELMEDVTSDDPLVVVRPDESPDGCYADRFVQGESDVCDACGLNPCECAFAYEDDSDEPSYDCEDSEDTLAGGW